jgi:hypothetical protein
MHPRLSTALGALLALAAGCIATPARAAPRQIVTASFTTTVPGAATGLNVAAAYGGGGQPYGLVHVIDQAPAGTVIDNSGIPQCTANEAVLILLGPAAACPSRSLVGTGVVNLDLGLPDGLGRLTTDVTLINAPGAILFFGREPHTGVALVERGAISGTAISVTIPQIPGLGPGLDAWIDNERFSITARSGLLRTPAHCHTGGWTFHRSHGYVDGVTQMVGVPLACRRRRRSKRQRAARATDTPRIASTAGGSSHHVDASAVAPSATTTTRAIVTSSPTTKS